jgi:hypothetical protein
MPLVGGAWSFNSQAMYGPASRFDKIVNVCGGIPYSTNVLKGDSAGMNESSSLTC